MFYLSGTPLNEELEDGLGMPERKEGFVIFLPKNSLEMSTRTWHQGKSQAIGLHLPCTRREISGTISLTPDSSGGWPSNPLPMDSALAPPLSVSSNIKKYVAATNLLYLCVPASLLPQESEMVLIVTAIPGLSISSALG